MRKTKNKTVNENGKSITEVPHNFHIEADRVGGGISVSISGVLSILDFGEESALVKLRRGRIKIDGKSLSISVYENKIVEISGNVCRMEFL